MARRDLFTGRSGQLAVMAEFLIRELNVAIPEVDVGDDIVVVRDEHDQVTRVQVKTANAIDRPQLDRFYAEFRLPMRQMESGPPHLVYAFAVRRRERWEEFVIVRRSVLQQLRVEHDVGSPHKDRLTLGLTFTREDIRTKGVSFQPFRSKFEPWPPLDEVPEGVILPVGE